MQKPLRKARIMVLTGVAAGTLTLLTASPASAIGVRPVNPTNQPASIANPPSATPLPPAQVPRPPAPAPAPVPPPAPLPPGYQPWHKIRPVNPTTQPASIASPSWLNPPGPAQAPAPKP